MTSIPKNCQHCSCYRADAHYCSLLGKPVGNVNTCWRWMPRVDLIMGGDVVFTEYAQYKLFPNSINGLEEGKEVEK